MLLTLTLGLFAVPSALQLASMPPQVDPTVNQQWVPGSGTGVNFPLGGGSGSAFFDDFNRANGPVGSGWVLLGWNFEVRNNSCVNTSGSTTGGWIQRANIAFPYDQATIEFDLAPNPSGLTWVAAVHGGGGSDIAFTKVQSSTNTYNTVAFYHGVNAGAFNGYGGSFSITPVTQGHVLVYVTNGGDTMNCDIDELNDGVYEYHYEASGLIASGLPALMGQGVGVGAYSFSTSMFDNWALNGGIATPIFDVFNIQPGQFFTLDISNLEQGSSATVLVSTAGAGPTASPLGAIEVSQPWQQTPAFPADANGRFSFTSTLPASLSGSTLYMQVVQLPGAAPGELSNALAVPIP